MATLCFKINEIAVADNIAILRERLDPHCELSGVVKANAYGLGIENVAPVMFDHGITLFFVANLREAVQLRQLIGPAPRIAVLGGYHADDAAWRDHHVIPILTSVNEVERWNGKGPNFLQIDTGMNRLGVRYDCLSALPASYRPDLVMSHFANADIRNDPLNDVQYQRFMECVSDRFQGIPRSLCNSAGVFSDNRYHLDVVRCGKAIYGAAIFDDGPHPMKQALTIEAQVLSINPIKAGETCGYGATYTFPHDAVVATLGVGYADGLPRALSNNGNLYFNGAACPVRGRVSMDLTTVEITHLAQKPQPGDWLEILGPHQSELDLAKACGTNTYEITTNFGSGKRYETALLSTARLETRKTGT